MTINMKTETCTPTKPAGHTAHEDPDNPSSPLPWVYSGDPMENWPIRDANGAAVNTGYESNIALIVRAVNSHAGLLDALQECCELLRLYPRHDPNGEFNGNMVPAKALAAIATLRAAGQVMDNEEARAVNSHDELLEALDNCQASLWAMRTLVPEGKWPRHATDIVMAAQAAIAKATGS